MASAVTTEFMSILPLYRPREIIQFCTEAKMRCVEIKRGKIDINSVVTAEAKYSQNRSKDLAAEHKFQFPGLEEILRRLEDARVNFLESNWKIFVVKLFPER